ncbi:hypothetical protein N656DRAFT_774946 [Canariomyces notabilis]|uniref:Uncharacterized protein n=1 Tax=Canariomyces notabilis TaxID=2074819 RepID=A0AAN6TLH6_9PEZI|nr:hypothetical protein N656DRAFT_774946 [Canariomyces arenarius]
MFFCVNSLVPLDRQNRYSPERSWSMAWIVMRTVKTARCNGRTGLGSCSPRTGTASAPQTRVLPVSTNRWPAANVLLPPRAAHVSTHAHVWTIICGLPRPADECGMDSRIIVAPRLALHALGPGVADSLALIPPSPHLPSRPYFVLLESEESELFKIGNGQT